MAEQQAFERYSGFARLMHWLVAVMILGSIAAGLIMVNLKPGDLQNQLYSTHKAFGIVILALVAVRVLYRLINGAPPPEPSLSPLKRFVSQATHYALYALLIAMPILGWAGTSAFGAPVPIFGLFDMPPLLAKDQELAKQIFQWHEFGAYAMAALVIIHAGAALHHHFVLKDNVLRRML
jgi:cytochrome b561